MKDIKSITTKDLVEELMHREGVEMILVDVMARCEVIVDNEFDKCIYAARRQDPEIILRITD